MSTIKKLLEVLNIRIYTNLYTVIILLLVSYLYYRTLQKEVPYEKNKVVEYLDSINAQNKILFSKLDSLALSKHEKITIYHKTTLKYDTLKIIVDSMPPLDATLFLLSKSRYLTNKGIE